jgi:hypothetical protein
MSRDNVVNNEQMRYHNPPDPTDGMRYNQVWDNKVDTSLFYIPKGALFKLRGHVVRNNIWNGRRETL